MQAVIVTGSRKWTNKEALIEQTIKALNFQGPSRYLLIHGACPTGADRIVSDWAKTQWRWLTEIPVPAAWGGKLGNSAGPLRNETMVRFVYGLREYSMYEVHGVAAPLGGPGTRGTIVLLNRFDIPFTEVAA